MSATQDLIAAALYQCDVMAGMLGNEPKSLRDLRELCARAMVQPDMTEAERLVSDLIHAVEIYEDQASEGKARTALLDYVRSIMAERQHAIDCADAYKAEADQFRDAAKMVSAASQTVGAAEVSMPEPYTYIGCKWSAKPVYSADKLETYGDAREAAGYARGLKEVNTALNDVFSAADGLSSAIDAALRGEVKP